MKKQSIILFFVFAAAALLLSGCGTLPSSSWPGVTPAGDVAYLANGQFLYAVRLTDGGELWRYPSKAETVRQFYAAPAVAGDQVIVGDYSGLLVGINTKTGQENWRYVTDHKFIAGPVVVNETIVVGNANGYVYALDMQGAEKWKYKTEQPIWSEIVSDGTNVYVAGMDHKMYALNLTTGQLTWSMEMGAAATYAPTLSEDGIIYVCTLDNVISAIRTTDGSVAWRKDMPSQVWARPQLVEGTLYFGDLMGKVYALNAKDGTQTWELQVGDDVSGGVVGAATVLDNGLAFATQKGKIFKVGTDQGRLGTLTLEGKLYSGPVYLADGTPRLLVSLVGGKSPLVAIDLNGTELWSFVPAK